jgi:aromatase
MAELRIRTARHTIRIAAPPKRVYQLITDVERWPQIFGPIVAVEPLGSTGGTERVRVWELVDGEVRSHVSGRESNPRRMQVRFRQDEAPRPVASMGGLWLVLPETDGCLVVLDHHYRVAGDDPVDARWLAGAVDHTSGAMLSALRDAAELDGELERLWLSCVDTMDIDGDARDVYDFLARAHDWPQRLPHVDRLTVEEEFADIQHLDAEIKLPNGSVHATSTVRVCFPETHIVYKVTRPPAIMQALTGTFTVTRRPRGVRATAHNTVLLRRDKIAGPLGNESTVEDVRVAVRDVLRSLSLSVFGQAKKFAEARRPIWVEGAA